MVTPRLRVQALDLELHLVAELLVESSEGLIHENEVRVVDEAPSDSDPLLLAPGEFAWPTGSDIRQTHELERLRHLAANLRLPDTTYPHRERDILEDRHMREEGVVLENHSQMPLVRGQVRHVPPVQTEPPGCWRDSARDDIEKGGLAGAARAKQREELTLLNAKVDGIEGNHRAVVLADSFEPQHLFSHAADPVAKPRRQGR